MTLRTASLLALSACALGVSAFAPAQTSLTYYFNKQGDDPSLRPSFFEVSSEAPLTLSLYAVASAPLPIYQAGVHFSFTDGTGTAGAGGSPVANGLTFSNFQFAGAFNTFALGDQSGNSAEQVSGTYKYGRFAEAAGNNNPFVTLGTTPTKIGDITLSVGSIFFVNRELAIESFSSTTNYSSYAVTATNGTYVTPGRYSATIRAVPEPASIAALGLGLVALVRRRRRA